MRHTRLTWRTGHGGDAPLSPLGGASPDVLMRQTSSAAAYPGATNPWQHAGAGSTASVASAVMATDRNAPEKDGERGWTWFALRALLVLGIAANLAFLLINLRPDRPPLRANRHARVLLR